MISHFVIEKTNNFVIIKMNTFIKEFICLKYLRI